VWPSQVRALSCSRRNENQAAPLVHSHELTHGFFSSFCQSPSALPTTFPTDVPSASPTDQPSTVPSRRPSTFPSIRPTKLPTEVPSFVPTQEPSQLPTKDPTEVSASHNGYGALHARALAGQWAATQPGPVEQRIGEAKHAMWCPSARLHPSGRVCSRPYGPRACPATSPASAQPRVPPGCPPKFRPGCPQVAPPGGLRPSRHCDPGTVMSREQREASIHKSPTHCCHELLSMLPIERFSSADWAAYLIHAVWLLRTILPSRHPRRRRKAPPPAQQPHPQSARPHFPVFSLRRYVPRGSWREG
jgi:hypothetical protein